MHKKQLNGREIASKSQEKQAVQELGLCGTHWDTVLALVAILQPASQGAALNGHRTATCTAIQQHTALNELPLLSDGWQSATASLLYGSDSKALRLLFLTQVNAAAELCGQAEFLKQTTS